MTKAQTTASDPAHSVWVAASAGTGKTKVLTDRVLRLLLNGVDPGHILCLTFTKAAAAEMATRIRQYLGRWATATDARLAQDIAALTGTPPDASQCQQARILFAGILDASSGLKIQTIHSFCQSIISQFPLEAGISPDTQVIDDKTAAELLHEAKIRLLTYNSAQTAEDVTLALQTIAWRFNDGSFTELLEELITQRHKLSRLFHHHEKEALIEQTYQALGADRNLSEHQLLVDVCDEKSFDRAGLQEAVATLLTGGKKDTTHATGIAAWIAADMETRIHAFSQYNSCFFTGTGEPRKDLFSKTATKNPQIEAILAMEQERLIRYHAQKKSQCCAELSTHLLHISEALLYYYETLKQQRGVVDFNDLIHIVIDLLQNHEAAAWVRYKLDGRIDHILVDEAQDTSPEQWDIIQALSDEFFVGDNDSLSERTLFVVGDEKQSIYSFQGADPDIFHNKHSHYAEIIPDAGKSWQSITLNTSFRSTAPVLQLVDAVFARELKPAISTAENAVSHTPHRNGHAGLVEIWPPVTLPDEEQEKPAPWPLPVTRRESPSHQKLLAEKIADTIDLWLKEKRQLPSKGRAVTPGDILILVRSRKVLVNHLVRELKQRQIPVAGSDRLILTKHIAVQDLMALGDFLLLPEDDLTLATVLKTPLFRLSEEALFTLAYQRGETSLWQRLKTLHQDKPEYHFAYTTLSQLLKITDIYAPFELYHAILEIHGGRKAFLSRLGHEASDPLDEFLSLTLEYEAAHTPSLQGFLHWLRQGETEIKRDMEHGSGEIRIMTVHGSKGLQAPIVFLPDTMDTPQKGKSRLLWSNDTPSLLFWAGKKDNENEIFRLLKEAKAAKEMNEYYRLLYVALTRPEDELYLCGSHGSRAPSDDCWYYAVRNACQALPESITDADNVIRLQCEQTAPVPVASVTPDIQTIAEIPPFFFTKPAIESAPAPFAPSRADDDETNSPTGNNLPAIIKGNFIHHLLETLPKLPEVQRRQAAQVISRHYDLAEKDSLIDMVLSLMDTPSFAVLFSEKSRAEVPIYGQLNNRRISSRVDRLVVTEDEVLIIDYKTSAAPPEDTRSVPRQYLEQMAVYKALLSSIYPKHTIRCFLLWTSTLQLMELENLSAVASLTSTD